MVISNTLHKPINQQYNVIRFNMTKLKPWIIPILAAILIGAFAFSLSQKPAAPDVTFTTLDGKKIRMSELKGKMVLVNFWATDCPGCVKEMPNLVETYQNYKAKGVEIIAVAMPYDPPAQVLNYQQVKKLPFPVMHDGFSEMTNAFGGVNLVPTTFIYNQHGQRIQKTIGELDFSQLHQLIQQELSHAVD
jgi:thiol-disulfide isomerase/thioredoxin